MSKAVKIRKGLNIGLKGSAELSVVDAPRSDVFAIKPPDFHGLTPKLQVKVGDRVKAGSPVFFDKYNEQILYTAPVSGEITEIVRGAKRRILEIRLKADTTNQFQEFGPRDPKNMTGEDVKVFLMETGAWSFVRQRPIDIVANPANTPKAIVISTFDSSPLAPDYSFILKDQMEAFKAGVEGLSRFTDGKVHLNTSGGKSRELYSSVQGVQKNTFSGPHPAGNVGVQIHHLDPINKGEYVWYVNPQDVAIIGRLFLSGRYDTTKYVAVTGSEVDKPTYVRTNIGAKISSLVDGNVKGGNLRYVSGNPLTGDQVAVDGYLGHYHSQVTVLPEGDRFKFLLTEGWLGAGLKKFSMSRSYFSWLMPNKQYALDTNLNGEPRSFVVSGQYEKVMPMDIYPVHLVKAIITNDIDGMENLGIYEVAPEDFALCEFVCTSKIDVQSTVRSGLDLINEECL